MTDRQRLVDQLILHEGVRAKPYMDTVGKITIGVGRNLSDVGLHESEIFVLLGNDLDDVVHDLSTFPWFAGLDPIRQRVLCDLRFNLGPTRFRGFKILLRKMSEADFPAAAHALQHSLWYSQVGTRGPRLVKMLRSGEDYHA